MSPQPHMAQRTIPSSRACTCPPFTDVNASDRTTHTGSSLIDSFSGRCGGYVKLEYITITPSLTKMNNDPADNNAVAKNDPTQGQPEYSKSLEADRNAIRTKRVMLSCSMCSHTSYYRRNLRKHLSDVHGEVSSHICRWCKKAFASKQTLEKHNRSLHKNINKVQCPFANCSKYLLSKRILQQHMNAVHTKKIEFNCTMCTFKTYYKSSLAKHWSRKHGEKASSAFNYLNYTLRLHTKNI